MYRRPGALVGWLSGLFVLFSAGPVVAHGDVPLAQELTRVPGGDQPRWVLTANFGVTTSSHPREYVCEESFNGGDEFDVVPVGISKWVIFTRDQILRTTDGCDFENVRSISQPVTATASEPASGTVVYLLHDGSEGTLWRSRDGGISFEEIEYPSDGIRATDVALSGDGDVILSAQATGDHPELDTGTAVFIRISDSTEVVRASAYRFPNLLDAEGNAFVWQARGDSGQVVVWGEEGSPVVRSVSVESLPDDADFGPDGERVWIAGVGEEERGFVELVRTDSGVRANERFSSHTAICVEHVGGSWYVCGRRQREGADLQRVDGNSLTDVLNFKQLEGPRSDCGSGTGVAKVCPTVWPDLRDALGIEHEGDADAGDAGSSTDVADSGPSGSPANGSGSSGCSTPGGAPAPWLSLAVVCLVVARRWT